MKISLKKLGDFLGSMRMKTGEDRNRILKVFVLLVVSYELQLFLYGLGPYTAI